MAHATNPSVKPADREALRRELLKRIVKSESLRRDQRKAHPN
jgi:hypothetical protein